MARLDHSPGEPRITYAMRLGADERRLIDEAASRRGVPTSQYIRTVALAAARRDMAGAGSGD